MKLSTMPIERTAAGTHAVVLGGSMAGLLAARVLSDHLDRVTLVERDHLPDGPEPRHGVPQGRHAHALLARGERILARLFPGLTPALRDAGATLADIGADLRWHHFGGYKVQFPSGIVGPVCSRPLLECEVRRRVLALPNVSALQEHQAVGLLASEDRSRVTGVAIRALAGGDGERRLDADLVVDATGRGSRAPAWLAELGYPAPAESEVRIGVGYTSRVYRRTPGDVARAKMLLVWPTPPGEKRTGVLFPIEGERWLLTLGGWLGDHPPTDEAGFLAFARSLPVPDLARIIAPAEPLGDFVVHKLPSNLRHHYEQLDRVPAGYLVTGDAVCSFNPVYGQGMTVAALEAEALDACLREQSRGLHSPDLPRRFFQRAAQVVDVAWTLAVGEDFRYPDVTGPKPPATALLNWYIGQVHRATLRDRVVYRAFLEVMAMLRPPTRLFQPRIIARVLRAGVTHRSAPRHDGASRRAA
jgi:2-polyprenyl-6-methoxyphenol hydroxylase-like FAD-dependent oxidoreductase